MRELDYFRYQDGVMPAKVFINSRAVSEQVEIMFLLRRFMADKRDCLEIEYINWIDKYLTISTRKSLMVMAEQGATSFLILVGLDAKLKLSPAELVSMVDVQLQDQRETSI